MKDNLKNKSNLKDSLKFLGGLIFFPFLLVFTLGVVHAAQNIQGIFFSGGSYKMPEGGSSGTPAAGKVHVYAKADGLLYSKDDAGVETLVSGGAPPGSQSLAATLLIDNVTGTEQIVHTPQTAPSHAEGKIYYNSDFDTFVMLNAETEVALNVGEEEWILARNTTGVTITNGQVVYVNGASGNRPTVALAQADAAATSEVIGIATHDIENNSNGYVTISGLVRDVDTSSFVAGDTLYLSASVAGGLANSEPADPNEHVIVGYVLTVNPSTGIILVAVHRTTPGTLSHVLGHGASAGQEITEIPSLAFDEGAAPGTPPAATSRMYVKADGLFYSKDDAGVETLMSAGIGGVGDLLADGTVPLTADWNAGNSLYDITVVDLNATNMNASGAVTLNNSVLMQHSTDGSGDSVEFLDSTSPLAGEGLKINIVTAFTPRLQVGTNGALGIVSDTVSDGIVITPTASKTTISMTQGVDDLVLSADSCLIHLGQNGAETIGLNGHFIWQNFDGGYDIGSDDSGVTNKRPGDIYLKTKLEISDDITFTSSGANILDVAASAGLNLDGPLGLAAATLVDETAAPGTPAGGRATFYAKADGLFYSKDDAGVETLMSGGAGGGTPTLSAVLTEGADAGAITTTGWGHQTFDVDGTYDIGTADGGTTPLRPRDVYMSDSCWIGDTELKTFGYLRFVDEADQSEVRFDLDTDFPVFSFFDSVDDGLVLSVLAGAVQLSTESTTNTALSFGPFFSTDSLVYSTAGTPQEDGLYAESGIHSGIFVEASTAVEAGPNVLTVTETGNLLTNEGIAAENHHDLPTAAANLRYVFVVQDADGIQINAATGDTIRIAGTVSASAGFISSTTVGDIVILVAINATEWVALTPVMGWTFDT